MKAQLAGKKVTRIPTSLLIHPVQRDTSQIYCVFDNSPPGHDNKAIEIPRNSDGGNGAAGREEDIIPGFSDFDE
jgi:hypothetical protein